MKFVNLTLEQVLFFSTLPELCFNNRPTNFWKVLLGKRVIKYSRLSLSGHPCKTNT